MPTNPDNTLILREPLSGRGASLLLSKGAEALDPDSMVEEAAPNDAAPVKSLPQQSILSLKLQASSPEPFEVGGFLQEVSSGQSTLSFAITCLTPIAIELSRLVFLPEPSFLIEAKVKTGASDEASWGDLDRMVLHHVSASEFVGSTATVRVQFAKAELTV